MPFYDFSTNFYELWEFQHTRLNSGPVGPVHYTSQTGLDQSNRSCLAVRPLPGCAGCRAELCSAQRPGGGVPAGEGHGGGKGGQERDPQRKAAPVRAAAAHELAPGRRAMSRRRRMAARGVPGGGGAQTKEEKGRGGRVRQGESHHYLESSRGGAEVGRRREGQRLGLGLTEFGGGGRDSDQGRAKSSSGRGSGC